MKSVAIIGAGPAGLAVLRSLANYPKKARCVAYETSDRVGGTWIFDDPYKPTTMYTFLRTNLPKEVMSYQGFPFSSDISQSFVGHKEVREYLESFTQHYQLHQYIKFRHTVVEVDPTVNEDDETIWNVTTEDCENGHKETKQFDSVIVCNGHFTVPLLPDIEGQDTYTNEIMHVHYYRSPLNYKNKTVLILGGGPSGCDIAGDLSPHVSKVYLSHDKPPHPWRGTGNVVQVAGIEKIARDDIILKDGTVVHADVILLATGYRYSFPFLSKKCHPFIEEEHVTSIYRLMVDIIYPTLFYIGLNTAGLQFPRFVFQAEYAVRCITGDIKPTSKEAMLQEYLERRDEVIKEYGRLKFIHDMRSYQWTYNDQLATACNIPGIPAGVVNLYKRVGDNRNKHHSAYKDAVYCLGEDQQQFNIISEPEFLS